MLQTLSLALFDAARNIFGADNEYTNGKGLRHNMGEVNVLIHTLTRALGAQYTNALVSSYALPAGLAMLGVIALQGREASEKLGEIHDTLDAQTALVSTEKFASYVWKYLRKRIGETSNEAGGASHWFFVYHPDTNWHIDFYALVEDDTMLKRLIAYSHSLPHLCYFMMHIRTCLQKRGSKKRIVFHLLMPAYRRIYIKEKLAFNPGLYPLVLEGHIYNSAPFVTLRVINKPERNAFRMREIHNLPADDAPSVWNLWNLLASETQTLDLGKEDTDDDNEESNAYYNSDSSGHGSQISQPAYARGGIPSPTRNEVKETQGHRAYTRISNGELVWVRRRPRHDA